MTPERFAAINEQKRLFDDLSLPEIVVLLRSGTNGSADEWAFMDVAETVAMLKSRLSTWEPGREKDKRFDNAVKELVEATLEEVERKVTT